MDLNQLVEASEILENLETIEDQILNRNKRLSKAGLQSINDIIDDCNEALSKTCYCGDKGRKEFERINAMILEVCTRIKYLATQEIRSGRIYA